MTAFFIGSQMHYKKESVEQPALTDFAVESVIATMAYQAH